MRQFNFMAIFLIIVCITLSSCEKDDDIGFGNNTCNVSNPAEELGWLKEAIDNVRQDDYSYYVMAKYNGETVFYYGNCNPLIDYVSTTHTCSGERIEFTNDFQAELTDKRILWKHKESKCNFKGFHVAT
jgi:hypothetical protein